MKMERHEINNVTLEMPSSNFKYLKNFEEFTRTMSLEEKVNFLEGTIFKRKSLPTTLGKG
jgi:hypothetical protein